MGNARHIFFALAGFVFSSSWVEAAPPAFENDIAAQSPLVWYKLNEPAGSSLAVNSGSIGSSLNGIAFHSPTFGAAADGGDTGVSFANGNGQQQYIQTANNVPVSLQGNPTFTAEALVYVPSNGQPSTPFYAPFLWWGGNGTGNSVYFSLSRLNFNEVYVGFYNSGLVMTGTINLDSWNLITWVRDSNGGTNNSLTGSTLYINGVEAATTSDTTLSGSAGILPTVQAGPVTIERAGDVSRYFSGTVADAAVFGKALSASVIAQQYADLTGTSAGSPSAPSITPGGVVAVDSTVTTIQPGEFVSIYGTNLGPMSPATWTGIFVTTLGGTSVTIDGNPAYLTYAGPTQINAQAPNDTNTTPHTVTVAVTTGGGTATSTVTLAQFAPSFLLFDSKHVTGIIVRTDGSGSQGGGTYDLLGPTGNSLGFPTVAAKAGDTVQLYAVGLGPTNPTVPAGQPFSSSAQTTNPVSLLINSMSVPPSFAGIDTSLLYQINLTVPAGLGPGDVPLTATVGGFSTQSGVVISLQ